MEYSYDQMLSGFVRKLVKDRRLDRIVIDEESKHTLNG